MATASIFEAKNHFSRIIKRVQEGETVVITSGRSKKEVAKIVPIEPVAKQRLGFMETPGFEIPDSFWEPLSDEECGYADDGWTTPIHAAAIWFAGAGRGWRIQPREVRQ